ncbi:MAG TPA: DUF2252 domain-containing protein [Pseudolysinimonas sp.]|jgi:uncharacterized protein (DUF2252 family)
MTVPQKSQPTPLDVRSVPSAAGATAAGVAARARVPRTSLADYRRSDRSATLLVEAQNADRVPELVPIRMQRMSADPFSFFRGSAAVMAGDLGRESSSGIEVISCGDAHVGNFGLFASPLRTLVFDLNDFDEAAIAPWEWDVKRLVTSAIIGARQAGFPEAAARKAGRAAAAAYRTGLAEMMRIGVADRYYSRVDTDVISGAMDTAGQRILQKTIREARRRTSAHFVKKSTELAADGHRIFVDDPPVLSHVVDDDDRVDIDELFREYRRTVSPDVAVLLEQYQVSDAARRISGVGSVGTRSFVVLLTDPLGQALVLQVKQASASVLQSHGGLGTPTGHEGRRVVDHQRVLQAVSDVFLGHVRFGGRDFYVRQFRDMKTSVSIPSLTPAQFVSYAGGCAIVLARAHAQSPRAAEVSGYLGSSSKADDALLTWGLAYAEQAADDYRAFCASLSVAPH